MSIGITLMKRFIDKHFCNCSNTVMLEAGYIVFIVKDKHNNRFTVKKDISVEFTIDEVIKEIEKQMIERYY